MVFSSVTDSCLVLLLGYRDERRKHVFRDERRNHFFINLNDNMSFVLHSQVAVANFYKSLNFISYGDEFFEDGISHIAMKHIRSLSL